MSSSAAGWLQFALLVAAIAVCYVPLGNYIAHVFTTEKDWRVERGFYKLAGIDRSADMKWSTYVKSVLAFSAVSVLFLYGMMRLQHYLFGFVGPHMANVPQNTSWNTAVSFVTNTNWQNYAGESTMTYVVQMSGLVVQQFLSAAVGLAVAMAMIRGFTRSRTDKCAWPGGHPGGMKCSPRSAGRGRRIQNGALESPRQVWRRARGTWDCRYEHEPQLRLFARSSPVGRHHSPARRKDGTDLRAGGRPGCAPR